MSRKIIFASFLLLVSVASGLDVPGGLGRTGEIAKVNTFEMAISPAYVMSPTGAYLTTELRYQVNEDFGAGFDFGAGEVGFNTGASAVWYVAPDHQSQPAVGILGGAYFNRMDLNNYFVVKLAPFVSKTASVSWGSITPYAGGHLSPSFRLSSPANQIALKATAGTLFTVKDFNGIRFWTEAGLGLANSAHEIVVGFSYPLAN